MILKKVTGCICDSLTVDGVEEIDLTDKDRRKVLNKISNYIKNLPYDCFERAKDLLFWFTDLEEGSLDVTCTMTMADIGEEVRLADVKSLNYVLQGITELLYDSEEMSDPCPCCGDYIITYTLEI